jgi:hypothetical protein
MIAIYLVNHGTFQEPRPIELQYRRIMRYIEARADDTDGSPDIFADFNSPDRRGALTLDQLPNLGVLRRRATDYTRIFIDIEDSNFANLSPLVRGALEGRGAKVLNVFYDDENVLDRKWKAIYGNNARVDDLTDGSDFTCFFPTLVSRILEAALRRETIADNPPSIWERILSLKERRPYNGGNEPFIEDRLSLEWKQRSK